MLSLIGPEARQPRFGCAGWILFLLASLLPAAPARAQHDWRSDWGVEKGFAISIDTDDYRLPTALAFVPSPGPDPKDPLYFVTELKGRIRVVTNDRAVSTFAEGFFDSDFPPESGMAGICLDPEHGYVFVTFAYQDEKGILRNNMVRFETEPGVFAVRPSAQVDFTDVFFPYESGESHQIGACQVTGGLVYVSVGDGFTKAHESQNIDSMLGKIIRMTVDGEPVRDNPFYEERERPAARDYVWALGLRNPFGMKLVGSRMLVADNGLVVDRFLEVERGENYLWDGTDWSIGTRSDFLLYPSLGVVQLAHAPANFEGFPEEYRNRFYLALSGAYGKGKSSGILMLDYDFDARRIRYVPRLFLRNRAGSGNRAMTGVAFGPDGLYFVVIEPDESGRNPVFKVRYAPDRPHPFVVANPLEPVPMMRAKGCLGCHMIDDFRQGGTAGPSLTSDSLVERLVRHLSSEEYADSVREIDGLDREPFASYRAARRAVLEAEGIQRARVWVRYRIQEPRFDRLTSQMPNLGLTDGEARLIAEFLVPEPKESASLIRRLAGLVTPSSSRIRVRHLGLYFAAGFVAGVLALAVGYGLLAFRRRRRRAD